MKSSFPIITYAVLTLASTVAAFNVPTNTVRPASSSPLFRVNDAITKEHSSSSLIKRPAFSPLHMTNNEEEVPDQVTETSSTEPASSNVSESRKDKKPRSGFWTALVLGPPLLAKFGVVLAVKFLTDLVVYPLLIIFRFAKDVKRKLFGNSEVNGEGVNGNSSSSS